LGVGGAVLAHNLVPEDAGELGEGLQVGQVDDERPQRVVEHQAQRLQELPQGRALPQALLCRGEELVVELELVLADVEEECAAGPHQAGVVPGVHLQELVHGGAHAGEEEEQAALQVVVHQVTQERGVLRSSTLPSSSSPPLHLLDQVSHLRRCSPKLAVEESEGGV